MHVCKRFYVIGKFLHALFFTVKRNFDILQIYCYKNLHGVMGELLLDTIYRCF